MDPSGYIGVEVNAAQAIEHEVQKIKSAPETLRTEGDHTPSPNKIDQLARQQVMINNPQLFTSEAKGQTYLIDVAPSFFEEGIGYTLGSMTDGIFAYFNDGYNPITSHVLNNQEILDTKVMGLFGFALPAVRFLRFGKKIAKPIIRVEKNSVGSYTNLFKSGKKYGGKGSRKRSQISAKEQAKRNNDLHIATDWKKSFNERQAFKDESVRIDNLGGISNQNNYNRIESPGKKFRMQDGEL